MHYVRMFRPFLLMMIMVTASKTSEMHTLSVGLIILWFQLATVAVCKRPSTVAYPAGRTAQNASALGKKDY